MSPASFRSSTARRRRSSGVTSNQSLPATSRTQEQFQWLAAEIEELGGEVLVWNSEPADPSRSDALVEQFTAQVEAEYETILKALKKKSPDLKQLAELESYGLVSGKGTGSTALYSANDLGVVRVAAAFMNRGVEARHLRAWKQSAEREAALFEQLVLPLLRQRNPQSRQQATTTLSDLSDLGGQMRALLLAQALRHHLEG